MDHTHLTGGADGVGHVRDGTFPMPEDDLTPPAPAMCLAETVATGRGLFQTPPAGRGGARHPSLQGQVGI